MEDREEWYSPGIPRLIPVCTSIPPFSFLPPLLLSMPAPGVFLLPSISSFARSFLEWHLSPSNIHSILYSILILPFPILLPPCFQLVVPFLRAPTSSFGIPWHSWKEMRGTVPFREHSTCASGIGFNEAELRLSGLYGENVALGRRCCEHR